MLHLPENCVDLLCAIKIHEALETLMSREKSPFAEAVLTIGKFQAGDAANVIPEQAVLEGALRAFQRGLPAPSRHHLRRQRLGLANHKVDFGCGRAAPAEGGASVAPPMRLLRYTGSTVYENRFIEGEHRSRKNKIAEAMESSPARAQITRGRGPAGGAQRHVQKHRPDDGRVRRIACADATSKSIGQMMAAGNKDEAEAAKERVRQINDQLAEVSAKREAADSELHDILLHTPNMPADTTPVGDDENDNPEVRRWGTPRDFEAEGITMKPHWDLGADLHLLEPERAVKLAASRFVLLRGQAARLERAIINFMADTHSSRGYTEWWCPAMANSNTLTGTGQLPKFEDDLFKTREGLYLIPTAEVQLTNIHAGEVLDAADLPLHYCAYTPCFREEAGSAGRSPWSTMPRTSCSCWACRIA